MSFIISYRDPREPTIVGATIVSSECQIIEATERLALRGYQVTRIMPPPIRLILEGKAPPRV